MGDTAFDDFLDSDDDAFFLEAASQQFLDYYSVTESTQTPEIAVSQNQAKTSTSLSDTSRGTQNVFNFNKISSKECEVAVNHNVNLSATLLESNTNNASDFSKMPAKECENTNKNILKESRIFSDSNTVLHIPKIISKKCVTDSSVASTSAECTSGKKLKKHPIPPDISSYIDSRFIPGFIPKAKERKLPGPLGFIEMFNESKEAKEGSYEEMFGMDMEFEEFVTLQFTPEFVSLISIPWQKLQTAVSSCPNVLSTVKYYSIKRVLQESSKIKLPKHMFVPVICVILKKISYEKPPTVPVFMDDTGKIDGKIDGEVLSTYKEYLVEGSALILKNVTFLFNVLLLKAPNLVSVYHPNGMETHPQTLDSILKTPDPLKPINCEFLYTSTDDRHEIPFNSNTRNNHKLGSINHSQSRPYNNSEKNKTTAEIHHCNKTPESHTPSYVGYSQNSFNTVLNQNETINKNISHLSSERSPRTNEVSTQNKIMQSDHNLLDEDNCIGEFDELLCDLDEQSFMEDL